MDLKLGLEIVTLAVGLIVIVYRVSKIEQKLYEKIDESFDNLFYKHCAIDKEVSNHIGRCDERHENVMAIIRQVNQKIDHKFKRLQSGQKQIQTHLQKDGFIIKGEEY